MASRRQTTRPGAFLISEEPGAISRDAAWLAEGENLPAGTLLAIGEDDDLVEWESGDCAGILFSGADARLARQRVTLVKRLATVNLELLAFGEAEEADVRDALAALRIVVLADHSISPGGGGGGEGYVAKAVHFDGATILTNDALVSTDNGDFSLSGWFNVDDWAAGTPVVFVSDPVNSYGNYMDGVHVANCVEVFISDNGSSNSRLRTVPRLTPGWHHVLIAVKTDLPPSPTSELWVGASSDWSNLVTACKGDYIYTSSDAGVTWTKRVASGAHDWMDVKVSSDGSIVVAVKNDDKVHVSADGGATWNIVTASGASQLKSVAMSADGSVVLVSDWVGSTLYLSTDSAGSFSALTDGPHSASKVFVTPDGTKMYAVDSGLFRSTDGGTTWDEITIPSVSAGVYGITASADGTKIALATFEGSGKIFISTDSGEHWSIKTPAGTSTYWYAMASSPNWETLAAVDNNGFVWTSSDFGVTWGHGVDGNFYDWVSVSISADGQKLVAGASGDGVIVHTSADAGTTWAYRRVITGTRVVLGYIDGVKAIQGYSDTGPSFNIAMNGLGFVIGGDTYDDNLIGDVADLWIAPGVSLLTGTNVSAETLGLFIDDNGKPVDPSGFPASAILLSGDADTFATNQGTGGAFTVTAGSLTNATTSPSD